MSLRERKMRIPHREIRDIAQAPEVPEVPEARHRGSLRSRRQSRRMYCWRFRQRRRRIGI